MKILAIDTATEGCSAALLNDDKIISRQEVVPRKHADLILPMLDEILAEAQLSLKQLDALAFGRGPGAFTGVRIATGVIQGIAFGSDLPVVPVSTLRALAQRTFNEYQHEKVLTAFDARMDEVYWAEYALGENEIMQLQGEEQVIAPEHVTLSSSHQQWVGSGSGWAAYSDVLKKAVSAESLTLYTDMITRADEIVTLASHDFAQGISVGAENALPVYLRNKVAKKKSA
ncbi:MAG: tRNA (adenosine(37)-N6)-threonylcarbamoyltransferase complex dimerization subunit type 1 TsaB [Gammaproteobacteria bacterium]|nr:tRNA (adenosine(37)-N6)-threonylcarbamoyltransferase complex dimerization subunit type 1 TsaB [Gammaproteobacteria bacterium]